MEEAPAKPAPLHPRAADPPPPSPLSVPALSLHRNAAAPAGERSNCLYAGRAAAPARGIARDDLQQRAHPLGHGEQAPGGGEDGTSANRTVTVPVAFHVIRKNATAGGRRSPQAQVNAQIDVLNVVNQTASWFALVSTTRTTESSWW